MTLDVKMMDQNKSHKTAIKPAEASAEGKQLWHFFGDTKEEFKKITWTGREELMTYTKLVIGTVFVFGMAIFLIDLMIQAALNTLGYLVRLIGG